MIVNFCECIFSLRIYTVSHHEWSWGRFSFVRTRIRGRYISCAKVFYTSKSPFHIGSLLGTVLRSWRQLFSCVLVSNSSFPHSLPIMAWLVFAASSKRVVPLWASFFSWLCCSCCFPWVPSYSWEHVCSEAGFLLVSVSLALSAILVVSACMGAWVRASTFLVQSVLFFCGCGCNACPPNLCWT